MGESRARKIKQVKERLKSSFLISEPFAWNYKQAEILEKMLHVETKCVIVDSLAGTGKTIMSTFAALKLLQKGECKKMYYVRSAVESANSKLMALPGSWEEKIAVYGGPLNDALNKLLAPEEVEGFFKSKTIEIIPLSYLRGRSFNNCIIILDEAQNCFMNEIITIMTRLEESSKLFIIADSDQCDLSKSYQNEFPKTVELFNNKDSEEHGIYNFEMRDPELVMRSAFVKFVSKRYSDYKKLIKV
jgi:phosphate starvation-inducible PhoH-like protein